MFICKKCGLENAPRRGNRSQCKKCEREYQKEWKKNHPAKQVIYNKKSNSSSRVKEIKKLNVNDRQPRRRHIKKLCVEYLGGICQFEGGCAAPTREGFDMCYATFQFHHVNSLTKKAGIATIINGKLTDTVIRKIQIMDDLKKYAPELVEELDKCQLLCANYHHRVEYCCKR